MLQLTSIQLLIANKKCALIGIGRAVSFAFVSHGVRRLALLDINLPALERVKSELEHSNPSLEVTAIQCDTSSTSSILEAHGAAISKLGRLDYAVNNAGIAGPQGGSEDVKTDDFRHTLEVNLTGVWTGQREQIRQMLKQEPEDQGWPVPGVANRGVIVNTASMIGIVGTGVYNAATAYTAAKHGVLGITKSDAGYYSSKWIRINAICPGFVRTPMVDGVRDGLQTLEKNEMDKTPMGRVAYPEEIAQGIVFLASPMSSYMTGSALVVDG